MREQILKLLRTEPFVPFTLVMSSGTRVPVRHPENALLLKHWIHVAVNDGESAELCYLPHVSNIERDAPLIPR